MGPLRSVSRRDPTVRQIVEISNRGVTGLHVGCLHRGGGVGQMHVEVIDHACDVVKQGQQFCISACASLSWATPVGLAPAPGFFVAEVEIPWYRVPKEGCIGLAQPQGTRGPPCGSPSCFVADPVVLVLIVADMTLPRSGQQDKGILTIEVPKTPEPAKVGARQQQREKGRAHGPRGHDNTGFFDSCWEGQGCDTGGGDGGDDDGDGDDGDGGGDDDDRKYILALPEIPLH